MDRLLRFLLKTFIRRGTFRVTTSRGTTFTVGDGTGQPVADPLHHARSAEWAIMLDPELKFGEAYMDGSVGRRARHDRRRARDRARPEHRRLPQWARPQWLIALSVPPLQQFNPRQRARRNVAHHYDLDGRLYSLFLDADRQYSCAYFETPETSRSTTRSSPRSATRRQAAARRRASACSTSAAAGAGLALYLAEFAGARRHRHHAVAGAARHRQRARRRKGPDGQRVEFRLQDYRDVAGPFDRIVSVGMFEHVGVDHYDTFFRKCARTARRRRRHAAALDRPLGRARASPIRGSPNTSSPAATSRRCPRCCPRSSAPACWSPTSRSCACTTPRR